MSVVGELAVAALLQNFKIQGKTSVTRTILENSISENLFNIENKLFTIKPVLELLLALRWETWLCCDYYHLAFEAGWEEQWWSAQNQFLTLYRETRSGDLVLHGLTLKVRFDF